MLYSKKMKHNKLWQINLWAANLVLISTICNVRGLESSVPPLIHSSEDPYVMKVYPDGTKVLLRWSEIGKALDSGEKHGGPPKIIAYNSQETISDPTPNRINRSASDNSWQGSNFRTYEPAQSMEQKTPSVFEGFYVSPQIGAAVVQDMKLNGLSGSVGIEEISIGANVNHLTFSTGVRFDFAMGYALSDWCSLEFSPGIIWSPLKTIDGNISATDQVETYSESGALNVDGSFIQVPLMGNLLFYIPTESPWRPIVGGGLGANYNYLNLTKVLGIDTGGDSGACWTLGYQAIAGFEYAFDGGYSLGLKYVFTGSTAQSFNHDLADVGTGGAFTQSVLLHFKAAF